MKTIPIQEIKLPEALQYSIKMIFVQRHFLSYVTRTVILVKSGGAHEPGKRIKETGKTNFSYIKIFSERDTES